MALFQSAVLNKYPKEQEGARIVRDYFTEQQPRSHALQAEIDRTDAAIDALVYQLYGLTEEVKVVEGK